MTTTPRDDEAARIGREPGDTDLTTKYVAVVIVWACVLAILFAFSRYFG